MRLLQGLCWEFPGPRPEAGPDPAESWETHRAAPEGLPGEGTRWTLGTTHHPGSPPPPPGDAHSPGQGDRAGGAGSRARPGDTRRLSPGALFRQVGLSPHPLDSEDSQASLKGSGDKTHTPCCVFSVCSGRTTRNGPRPQIPSAQLHEGSRKEPPASVVRTVAALAAESQQDDPPFRQLENNRILRKVNLNAINILRTL